VLLVGGGSGVVPLMAMLRHRRRTMPELPMRLVYSVRSAEDVIYRDELGDDALLTFTREPPEGWSGRTGRLDASLIAEAGVKRGPPSSAARTVSWRQPRSWRSRRDSNRGRYAPSVSDLRGEASTPETSRHHLGVVGGGFGGLQLALKLRRGPVEVTLVDWELPSLPAAHRPGGDRGAHARRGRLFATGDLQAGTATYAS